MGRLTGIGVLWAHHFLFGLGRRTVQSAQAVKRERRCELGALVRIMTHGLPLNVEPGRPRPQGADVGRAIPLRPQLAL